MYLHFTVHIFSDCCRSACETFTHLHITSPGQLGSGGKSGGRGYWLRRAPCFWWRYNCTGKILCCGSGTKAVKRQQPLFCLWHTKSCFSIWHCADRKKSSIVHREVTSPPCYGTGVISEVQTFPLLIDVRQASFKCSVDLCCIVLI